MPNNLLEYLDTTQTGKTVYAHSMNSAGQWFNTATPGDEAYSAADFGNYAILLTETGQTGYFTATVPSGLPVGTRAFGFRVLPSLTAAVSNVALTSNVATLTATAHGFTSGRVVVVSGLTNTLFNGQWTITAVTTNTFSFALTHANVGSTADSGTAVSSAASASPSDSSKTGVTFYWDGTNLHTGPVYVDDVDGVTVEATDNGIPAINLRQSLAMILDVCASLLSGAQPGGGTITISSPGGSHTRLQMRTDGNGNRQAIITWNPPA